MKLTVKEKKWLERLEKTLDAAPASLASKVTAYTIGDNNITLYDKNKFDNFMENNPKYSSSICIRDVCWLVGKSESEIKNFYFPFTVESTAG